jgi:hypothetical protein
VALATVTVRRLIVASSLWLDCSVNFKRFCKSWRPSAMVAVRKDLTFLRCCGKGRVLVGFEKLASGSHLAGAASTGPSQGVSVAPPTRPIVASSLWLDCNVNFMRWWSHSPRAPCPSSIHWMLVAFHFRISLSVFGSQFSVFESQVVLNVRCRMFHGIKNGAPPEGVVALRINGGPPQGVPCRGSAGRPEGVSVALPVLLAPAGPALPRSAPEGR